MFTVAVPAVELLPPLVTSAPAAIVLVAAPAAEEVTLTTTVQPPEGMPVPLATVKLLAGAVAVTPRQVPVLFDAYSVMPLGKVSVNVLTSVIVEALLLLRVTVSVVLPPEARLALEKAFVTVGGPSTVRLAVVVPPVSATGPTEVTAVVVLVIAPFVLEMTSACN